MTQSSQNKTQTNLQIELLPVTPFQQNCSMLWDAGSREGVFVDPGGEPERLLKAAQDKNITIREVWLTHGHLDHAGAAHDIREATGAKVIGPHKDDQFWLDIIEQSWAQYGHPGMGKNLVPDQYLEDGDVLTLGEETFHVLHTPGHTPGHVVIYHDTVGMAFVGDVIFRGSIGRTDFPKGDHDQLIESIRTKLWPLGNAMRFIPGHGPMSTFGAERGDNPFVADHVIGTVGPKAGGVM